MKKFLLVSSIIIQSCVAFAQNCENDTIVREIQFPLTEQDTATVFYYFNNEWFGADALDIVKTESILKIEVKNDEYGNRAAFFTVSPETLDELDKEYRKVLRNFDPRCEFPGGNGKLKEWLDANIRIPEGYKGHEKVAVSFRVQPDGTITDPKIMRPSKNEAANAEALRLVNALPKFRVKYFTPKKAPLSYMMAITFKEPGLILIR